MKKKFLFPLLVACMGVVACSNSAWENPSSGTEVSYIDLSESYVSLGIGASTVLTAAVDKNVNVRWTSSDSAVVSVSANGTSATVTGLAKGSANVVAYGGGKMASCVVTVGGGNGEPSYSITISETSKTLDLNSDFVLTASTNATSAISWSSSAANIASVEKTGDKTAKVHGLSVGMATITAKVGTKTANCYVTVENPENPTSISISLNKSYITLEEGNKDSSLVASVRPSDLTISWQSNDQAVATVDQSGAITAVSAGTATISATVTKEGAYATASCTVKVNAKGGVADYDAQIASWSQAGHLYLHYLRTTDTNYSQWAVWAWPNYPDDGEGSLWGATQGYDTKGVTPQTYGWMTNAQCGGTGNDPYVDEYGQVMDLILDQSKAPGGKVVGGRTGNPAPLIADDLWDNAKFFPKAAIGFLIVDQSKMDGSDMWTSDGGAESYIKKIGKLMPAGKDGYLHIYCVEGNVANFTVSSGTQEFENQTATDDTGKYRSKSTITDLKADAYRTGVSTSSSFLEDRPGTGYQIFVPSFSDSDGDGYGDIKGITNKLDYLEDLGVDVLWLTPIQESNSYHGYDVTDYYKIDQRFGTLEDYQELLYKAHQRGMKVLMDMVINHTSKSNVLYKKSQMAVTETLPNGKEINYRDMYLWKFEDDQILEWNGVEASDPKKPYGVDNPATFVTKKVQESKDWYRDGTSKYFYYGKFGSGMAELNYSSQATRDYMTDMCKYWLSFGLDGFRLDAIKHIYLLAELDPTYNYSKDYITYDVGYRTYYNPEMDKNVTVQNDYTYDRDLNVIFWKQFAGTIKSAYPNCFLVGENFDGWNERIAPFYESMDSQFDFSTYYHLNESTVNGGITAMGGDITATLGYNNNHRNQPINGAFTSNHDIARLLNHAAANSVSTHHVEINSNNATTAENRARWFAAVTLLTPGVSWIYYGDELGMSGNLEDKIGNVDDHGNNTDRWYRQPMRWGRTLGENNVVNYGFGGLDVVWDLHNQGLATASEQQANANSMFNYFKALCHVKGDMAYPTYGKLNWTGTIGGDTNTLSMQITDGYRTVNVFINASSETKTISGMDAGVKIGGSHGTTDTTIPAYGFLVVKK